MSQIKSKTVLLSHQQSVQNQIHTKSPKDDKMKIAQISLFALSSIDAQPAEISPAPFNYDDEFTSYDDSDATLDGRKVPNRHPKARLRTLGKI